MNGLGAACHEADIRTYLHYYRAVDLNVQQVPKSSHNLVRIFSVCAPPVRYAPPSYRARVIT